MVTVEFDSMGEAVRLALVAGEYAGGGLAVRVGFGDAETIDCETGRTVYVAG